MKKLIPLFTAAALLLSGCQGSIYSNYRETERIRCVETLGLDSGEKLTRLSLSSPEGEGGSLSREAESILRCLASAQSYAADKELYYAHSQFLLLGEDYAREYASEALDFVARDNQLRLGLDLFIVKGGEASELISGGGETDIGKTLSGLRREWESSGRSRVFTCREVIRSLSRHGAAAVCALSGVKNPDGSLGAVPDGYAVLKDGRLAGYVPREQVVAANLLLGKAGNPVLSVPDGEGGMVELVLSKSKLKISQGGGRFFVKARLTVSLAEPDTPRQHITDREYLAALEETLAAELEDSTKALLELSKALEADFLGLGSYLKSSEKGENWLKNAVFDLDYEVKIDYSRALADKMGTTGGGE